VSFRTRITLVLTMVVILATLVMAVASLQAARVQIYGELDRALAQASRVADAGNGPGRGPGGSGQGVPRVPALVRLSDAVVAQTHQPDGTVALVNGAAPVPVSDRVIDQAASGTPTRFSTDLDGLPYRGVARVLADDVVLVVAADASEQARVLRALLVRFWLIGLVVAGLAALLGWYLAGRLVAPLTRLTAAAEQVSATGDLAVDVRTEQADEAGRLSRAFDEMLAALAASRAAQQRLVDDAGHELRTPITSILSNAEVLKRHPDLDATTRQQIADDVIAESQELTRLVNALVDLAGVAGEAEEPQQVSVAVLVHAAVRRLPADERHRVSVLGDATAEVRSAQLQRALANVLVNATKFDRAGGPVETAITEADGWVYVTVRDHGPGFAEDDLPHVFARFYRSDTARGTPGSGLGLAIVHEVVTRAGGWVRAGNHPDGGGLLQIALPIAAEQHPVGT
jgi:two-component system sensor histidine kinase MprB